MSSSNPHVHFQEPYSTNQAQPTSKKKLFTHLFCKSILFMVFVVALPLIPSLLSKETTLTKFWEVFRLVFVGIALCYGLLLSRRSNSEKGYETYPMIEDSESSYVSRIFQVSSIFEDVDGNSCGYDEKNMYQTWYAQHQGSGSLVSAGNFSSLDSESGFQVPYEQIENNVSEAWNSVSIRNESTVRNSSGGQFSDQIESGTGRSNKDEIFGEMGGVNLEEKFNETVISSSQIPWDLRSEIMELKEELGSESSCHSHFRPEAEDLGKQKGFRASYPPVSQSTGRSIMNNGAPLNAFHLRRYSSGSLFRKDVKESSEDRLKNLARNIREGSLSNLKLDRKPLSSIESSSRGRSVRTIQDSKFPAEAENGEGNSRNLLKKHIDGTIDEEKVMRAWTNEMKEGKFDAFAVGTKLKNLDTQFEKYRKK